MSLQTVPKIKVFLWRALSGALVVAEGFVSHGINTDLLCQGCLNASESIRHVLFLRTPARRALELADIPPHTVGFSGDIYR